MDFFTLQDNARKQTRFLVFLFIIAVLAIILTTNLIFFIAAKFQTTTPTSLTHWLSQPYWLYITGGTLLLIVGASFWRSWQLRATPDAIAKMVNATPVALSTKDKQQRVLVNVVEEMSIASGMPIPKIFIMQQEQGINAFVAGLEPSKVTLVVTQGLLNNLTRQELQGVIAHEYSHVFHGDMRINVRLIGILAGILVIGQLGGILLRSGGYRSYGVRRSAFTGSSNKKSSGNTAGIMLLGLGLFAVGYIGLFFGRMIKAAISRQREFLADASAVQYTRDKEGIAGALYKISVHQNSSLLKSGKAEEMSHMCFGESVTQSFTNLLATHPPITDRIKAINPGFAMRVKYKDKYEDKASHSNSSQSAKADETTAYSQINDAIVSQQFSQDSKTNTAETIQGTMDTKANKPETIKPESIKSEAIISSIGNISEKQVILAKALFNSLPKSLLNIAHGLSDKSSSYILIMALLIANQKNSVDRNMVKTYSMDESQFAKLVQQLSRLTFQQQHCLLDMSLARIEQLEEKDNKDFVAALARLVAGDKEISQTEFMIYASAVKRALPSKTKSHINRFKQIDKEVRLFFNLLYQQSSLELTSKQSQFDRQMKLFGIQTSQLKNSVLQIAPLSQSLNKIAQLNPLLKKDFIQACIDIIKNDDEILQTEYELLRILGEYLDSPIPIHC